MNDDYQKVTGVVKLLSESKSVLGGEISTGSMDKKVETTDRPNREKTQMGNREENYLLGVLTHSYGHVSLSHPIICRGRQVSYRLREKSNEKPEAREKEHNNPKQNVR